MQENTLAETPDRAKSDVNPDKITKKVWKAPKLKTMETEQTCANLNGAGFDGTFFS